MYAFLRGTIAFKGLDHVALDVNGAGYEVHVPESVLRRLSVNQDAQLLTYCYIREDTFRIYGFLKEEEKALFTTMLDINGVGPKAAMALLSALSVQQFGRAIHDNDVTALTKAPGVGKKLAQRIVLEMKSRMGQTPELGAILGEAEAAEPSFDGDDAYEALLSLGCTPAEAKKAVGAARKELGDGAPDEAVVRAALRSMAKVK